MAEGLKSLVPKQVGLDRIVGTQVFFFFLLTRPFLDKDLTIQNGLDIFLSTPELLLSAAEKAKAGVEIYTTRNPAATVVFPMDGSRYSRLWRRDFDPISECHLGSVDVIFLRTTSWLLQGPSG